MDSNDVNQDETTITIPIDYMFRTEVGPPVEAIADDHTRYGKDAWGCVPHACQFPSQRDWLDRLRDNFPTTAKLYIEWSNEVWNSPGYIRATVHPGTGQFDAIFPTEPAGIVWVKGSFLEPAPYAMEVDLDLIPQPTVPTWDGNDCFAIGPNARNIPSTNAKPGKGNLGEWFEALYAEIGSQSDAFFAQAETSFAGQLSRIVKVLGTQYANPGVVDPNQPNVAYPGTVITGAATCPRRDLPAGAPYAPGTPTYPRFDPDTQTTPDILSNLILQRPAIEENIDRFVEAAEFVGTPMISYEGGGQLVGTTRPPR